MQQIRTYFKFVTATIFLCFVSSGYAQTKKKSFGSFQQQLTNSQISVYLDSAQQLASTAPLRAIDNINKAIELSISDNDKNNEALSYWILGNIQQSLDQHELAIGNYKKCISTLAPNRMGKMKSEIIPTGGSLLTLFNAYKNIAQSYMYLNKMSDAESFILNCYDYRFKTISNSEKLDAQRIHATIIAKQGKTDEAITLLLKTIDQEKKVNNTEGEIKTLVSIGTIYQQNKNETKALEYYNQAKKLSEKTKGNPQLVTINNLLAQIFRQQKKLDKELEVRNNNIQISTTPSKTDEIIKQNAEIGNAYANTNQMDKALPFFEKSLYDFKKREVIIPDGLFEKSNDLESMANTYKILAEEYLKMGDTEKALAYLKTFVQVQDSIKSIRRRELDNALKLSNEIGKNQQRIDLLEKERSLNEKSIEILKQDKELKEDELYSRNIIIGTLCFLITFMIVGVFYILKSSREKRRANQLLAIKSLRGQMNPHFIFNALNSVNHYISRNDELSANKYLSDFSKLMRSVMETSKHDLISLTEEIEILKLYLQLEHARFKDKFDYSFTIDENIDTSEFELPPMIIQPFIENAIWHGLRYIDEKGFLKIDIQQNKEGLLVSIIDNGIGRKKSIEIKTKNQKLQNSTGMQNIENRIRIMNELFGSTITANVADAFENADNTGTKVNLFIPKKINTHA